MTHPMLMHLMRDLESQDKKLKSFLKSTGVRMDDLIQQIHKETEKVDHGKVDQVSQNWAMKLLAKARERGNDEELHIFEFLIYEEPFVQGDDSHYLDYEALVLFALMYSDFDMIQKTNYLYYLLKRDSSKDFLRRSSNHVYTIIAKLQALTCRAIFEYFDSFAPKSQLSDEYLDEFNFVRQSDHIMDNFVQSLRERLFRGCETPEVTPESFINLMYTNAYMLVEPSVFRRRFIIWRIANSSLAIAESASLVSEKIYGIKKAAAADYGSSRYSGSSKYTKSSAQDSRKKVGKKNKNYADSDDRPRTMTHASSRKSLREFGNDLLVAEHDQIKKSASRKGKKKAQRDTSDTESAVQEDIGGSRREQPQPVREELHENDSSSDEDYGREDTVKDRLEKRESLLSESIMSFQKDEEEEEPTPGYQHRDSKASS